MTIRDLVFSLKKQGYLDNYVRIRVRELLHNMGKIVDHKIHAAIERFLRDWADKKKI